MDNTRVLHVPSNSQSAKLNVPLTVALALALAIPAVVRDCTVFVHRLGSQDSFAKSGGTTWVRGRKQGRSLVRRRGRDQDRRITYIVYYLCIY